MHVFECTLEEMDLVGYIEMKNFQKVYFLRSSQLESCDLYEKKNLV